MNKLLILTATLALQSCATYAPPTESMDGQSVFDCREPYSSNYNILLRATAIPAEGIGTIKVAGVEHPAYYEVTGFTREWRFGPIMESGGHTYAFTIKPDGTGFYFDFTLQKPGESHVSSSDSFECTSSY